MSEDKQDLNSVQSALMKTMEEICDMIDMVNPSVLQSILGLDVKKLQNKQAIR